MAKKVRHKKDPATRKQCRLISQLQTELAIKDGKLPANMKAVDKIQNAKDIENALVNAGHLTKGMASEAIVNMKKQLENKKQLTVYWNTGLDNVIQVKTHTHNNAKNTTEKKHITK